MARGHHLVCSCGGLNLLTPGLDGLELEVRSVLESDNGHLIIGLDDLGSKTSNEEIIPVLEVLAVLVLEGDLVLALLIGSDDLAISTSLILVGNDDTREDESLLVLGLNGFFELLLIFIGEVGGPEDLLVLGGGLLGVDKEEDDGSGELHVDLRDATHAHGKVDSEALTEQVEGGDDLSGDDSGLDEVSEEIIIDVGLEESSRELAFTSLFFSRSIASCNFGRNSRRIRSACGGNLFTFTSSSSGRNLRPLELLEGSSDGSEGSIESVLNLLLVVLAPTSRLIGINTSGSPRVECLKLVEEGSGSGLETIGLGPLLILGIKGTEDGIAGLLGLTTEVGGTSLSKGWNSGRFSLAEAL